MSIRIDLDMKAAHFAIELNINRIIAGHLCAASNNELASLHYLQNVLSNFKLAKVGLFLS